MQDTLAASARKLTRNEFLGRADSDPDRIQITRSPALANGDFAKLALLPWRARSKAII
jgi:hypothetical protein